MNPASPFSGLFPLLPLGCLTRPACTAARCAKPPRPRPRPPKPPLSEGRSRSRSSAIVTWTCWSFSFYERIQTMFIPVPKPRHGSTHFSMFAQAFFHSILITKFDECDTRATKSTLRKLHRRYLKRSMSPYVHRSSNKILTPSLESKKNSLISNSVQGPGSFMKRVQGLRRRGGPVGVRAPVPTPGPFSAGDSSSAS